MKGSIRSIQGRHALCLGEPERAAPPGWQWVRLDEVAKLESGHTPSRDQSSYWNGDIAWIGIKDARANHGQTIEDTAQKVTPLGIANSSARLLPAGTVCLSRTASVGYVLVLGREMATSQDFVNWVCSPALEPRFLQYLFIAEGDGIRRFGKGSTHTTIYFEAAEQFRVCLPGADEQRRIVAKLDDLLARSRATREGLTAVLPMLERYRQSVLAAAFRGELTAEWRENRGTRSRQDWTTESLGGLAVANGTAIGPFGSNLKVDDYRDAGVPLVFVRNIRSEDFSDSRSRFVTPEKARDLSVHSVKAGDLLITKMGDPPGDTSVYPADRPPGIITSDCIRLSPCPKTTSSFLRYWLRADVMKSRMLEEVRGVAQQKMSLTRFRLVEVPLPPLPEQQEIVRRVDAAFARIAAVRSLVEAQLARLDALDRSILARAFRGELVPQDPSDEPASALLDRIRAERAAAPAKPARRGRPAAR